MATYSGTCVPAGQQYKTTARVFPACFCSIHTLKVARFLGNMSVLSNPSKTKVNTFFFQLKKTTEVFYFAVIHFTAWLLLTDDDEYRFSCLCVGFSL
jgi:hypothetical protein